MRCTSWFVGFVLKGETTLRELARCYPLGGATPRGAENVADLFAARFHGRPRVGDAIALGGFVLAVLAQEADRVTEVGLLLLG